MRLSVQVFKDPFGGGLGWWCLQVSMPTEIMTIKKPKDSVAAIVVVRAITLFYSLRSLLSLGNGKC